ncbi:MAG: carbohydrate ABC transporter permease [Faecousia sp.]
MTKIMKIRIGSKKIPVSRIFLFIGMCCMALLMIAPFLWVFSASVRTYADAVALPPKWLLPVPGEWRLEYITKLFDGSIQFFNWMKNSLTTSAVITLGMTIHGCAAGYAYARLKFRGKNLFFSTMLVGMMVPIQVTIVPLYRIMSGLGLANTHWALTLPSIFGALCPGLAGAFGIFMMRQFFLTVPKELEESARIDGASPLRTFASIMLPMAKSSMVSLAIVVFTYAWNDFFTAFIMMHSSEKLTLPVGILQIKTPLSTGDNVVFAAVTLSIVPVLLVYVVAQKWITESMTHVGIKG